MARASCARSRIVTQMAGCERVGVIGNQQLEARSRAVWANQNSMPSRFSRLDEIAEKRQGVVECSMTFTLTTTSTSRSAGRLDAVPCQTLQPAALACATASGDGSHPASVVDGHSSLSARSSDPLPQPTSSTDCGCGTCAVRGKPERSIARRAAAFDAPAARQRARERKASSRVRTSRDALASGSTPIRNRGRRASAVGPAGRASRWPLTADRPRAAPPTDRCRRRRTYQTGHSHRSGPI